MPQYVNYAKIKDYDKVCYIPDEKEKNEKGEPLYNLNPITNYLRIATMGIGLHSITEKNYKDFYQRLMFQRELSEYKTYLGTITLDDVKSGTTSILYTLFLSNLTGFLSVKLIEVSNCNSLILSPSVFTCVTNTVVVVAIIPAQNILSPTLIFVVSLKVC